MKTIPETPGTGERYAEATMTPGRWDVCDWQQEWCRSCAGTGKINEDDGTQRKCLDCRGTGEGALVPCAEVCNVSEADARLLVFGPAAVEALRGVVAIAKETHVHWDADRDAKVGKHLAALAGYLTNYRDDATAVHATLAHFPEQEQR